LFRCGTSVEAEAAAGADSGYDARKAFFKDEGAGNGAMFNASGAVGALVREAMAASDDGDVRVRDGVVRNGG